MAQNQVLPVSSSRIVDGLDNFVRPDPVSAMNMLQYSVRAGVNSDRPLGYVQKITWSMSRDAKEVYQIEALPDAIYNENRPADLTEAAQYQQSDIYYPGEPVEVIPGYAKPINVTLERVVMNGGTGLEAVLNTSDAAEYNDYNNGNGYDPFVNTASGNRAITPLQQVRPITLTSICFSPTQRRQVIYGVKFVDGWITEVTGWDINTGGDSMIVESIKMLFPKLRIFNPPAA